MSKQHIHNHGNHSHDHHHHLKGRNLIVTIWLNILITVFQVIGSIISGSLSLLSDAIHNLSDVFALIISLIAEKLSKRETTASKTFGYKRAEILAALINSVSLIVIAIFLIREAFLRILTHSSISIKGEWVIALAALGILVNGLSVLFLKKHTHDSLNIKSAYLHLFTDMLSSVAVLVGGIFMLFKQIYWIDSVLTIFIGLYLLYSSWAIFISTIKILMHFTPDGIDIYEIKHKLELIKDVYNVHHIHIWNLNDRQIHFECHADLCRDLAISEINPIHIEISKLLHDVYGVEHITVQFEYKNCHDNH
jgi:cobalt-zinc-cadmium efflux system protein